MRIFHVLAYDALAPSLQDLYTDPRYNQLLGTADVLHVSGYVANAGSTAGVAVFQECSFDNVLWTAAGTPAISTVVNTSDVSFQGIDPLADTNPRASLARFRFQANADSGLTAYVRLWVTGRDLSRRAANVTAASNGASLLSGGLSMGGKYNF